MYVGAFYFKMLPSVKFAEDKVLTFLILRILRHDFLLRKVSKQKIKDKTRGRPRTMLVDHLIETRMATEDTRN